MSKNFKMEAPWITHKKMLHAMFDPDPQIIVGEIEESQSPEFNYVLGIQVRNHDKFVALTKVLVTSLKFGNVKMEIILYDEENSASNPYVEIYQSLFNGNPLVKDIKTVSDPAGTPIVFVRFQPKVIQFFNDDISDYSGNWNGLAKSIAEEIFNTDVWSVHFCTASLKEDVESTKDVETPKVTKVKPGQWP